MSDSITNSGLGSMERISDRMRSDLESFVTAIDGVRDAVDPVLAILRENGKKRATEFRQFAEPLRNAETKRYSIPPEKYQQFVRLRSRSQTSAEGYTLTARSLLTAAVSILEYHMGSVLRWLFTARPDILKASQRTYTAKEVFDITSKGSFQDHLIGKEVEALLREGLVGQLKILEDRASCKLREGLACLPQLVEIHQRRNLFVHCNGAVSAQYLDVCGQAGVQGIDSIKVGESLKVGPKYLRTACDVILEVGVKLGQVIWRKFLDGETENADNHLTSLGYSLIVDERYDLASRLMEFGTHRATKHANDLDRKRMIVNRAQSELWAGRNNNCIDVLRGEDWSSCSAIFRIAEAVLLSKFEEAQRLMATISKNTDEIREHDWFEWPLFKEFRKTDYFRRGFSAIYGERSEGLRVVESVGHEGGAAAKDLASPSSNGAVTADGAETP